MKIPRQGSLFFKALLLVYFVTVAYLCFGHFDNLPQVSRYIFGIPTDKVVHFVMFLPFPILVFLAIDRFTTKPWHSLLMMCGTFLVGCMLAAGTEYGQSLLTYRSCDVKDFRADMIALSISSLIVFIIDILKQVQDED